MGRSTLLTMMLLVPLRVWGSYKSSSTDVWGVELGKAPRRHGLVSGRKGRRRGDRRRMQEESAKPSAMHPHGLLHHVSSHRPPPQGGVQQPLITELGLDQTRSVECLNPSICLLPRTYCSSFEAGANCILDALTSLMSLISVS
eukprot:2379360-Amphidinium_carterae.1